MPGASKLRSRDFLELAIVYGLILLALWTPNPVQRGLFWIALCYNFAATFLFRRSDSRSLGLSSDGLRKSFWVVVVALAFAAWSFWLAYRLGTLRIPVRINPLDPHTWLYLVWAFVQQFILQDFFLARLLRLLPSKAVAIVASAALFAIAHLPNPVLVPSTLVWGLIACALFVRYHDLYSLAAVHAIFGIGLAMTVPNSLSHQMRVGLGYLQYRPPSVKLYLNQSTHSVSTDAWVMADAISLRSSRHALP